MFQAQLRSISTLLAGFALLSACSSQTPAVQNLNAQRALQAQSAQSTQAAAQPRILETFKAFVGQRKEANRPDLELLFEARSLLGKTYRTGGNSTIRYYLRFNTDPSESMIRAYGAIRFGRDGAFYIEEYHSETKSYYYFRLGTYRQPQQWQVGSEIEFKLDPGVKLDMHWQGINPMAKNYIQVISSELKPVQKANAEFF